MITEGAPAGVPPEIIKEERFMNCLCNLFNDNWVWLIILAVILFSCCNTNGCSCHC